MKLARRSRRRRHAGRHRRDRRPAALPHHAEADRRARGRDPSGSAPIAAWRPDGRLGVFGISFAGGLSIVRRGAAAACAARRLRAVVRRARQPARRRALPVHRASSRTARSASRTTTASSSTLINTAEQVVPPEQVGPLRAAIVVVHARASTWRWSTRRRPPLEFKQTRGADSGAAGAGAHADELRQHAQRAGARADPAAAHRRVHQRSGAVTGDRPTVTAPVFLLHGADDNVVPAIESRRLAAVLERTRAGAPAGDVADHPRRGRPPADGRRGLGAGSLLARGRGRGRAVVAASPAGLDAGLRRVEAARQPSGASARRRRGSAARHGASAARPAPPSPAASAW